MITTIVFMATSLFFSILLCRIKTKKDKEILKRDKKISELTSEVETKDMLVKLIQITLGAEISHLRKEIKWMEEKWNEDN